MNIHSVYNRLLLMTGEDEDQELLLTLCSCAAREIKEKMRDDCPPEDERLTAAAAGLAYYMLALTKYGGDDAGSFKAGDITLSRDRAGAISLAQQVRDSYYRLAAGLLKDDGFFFGQVTA